MKLRNFLYLNTKVVEDYIAAIDGYTYDEESQAISTSKENAVSGKGTIGVASGNGSHVGKQSEEIKNLCILVTPQSLKKSINIFDRMTKD